MKNRRQRLLLVGWDSADWKIIRPLLNAGELPGLARLSPFRLPPGAISCAPARCFVRASVVSCFLRFLLIEKKNGSDTFLADFLRFLPFLPCRSF